MEHRFLKYLDDADWERLEPRMRRQRFGHDEVIVEEGTEFHAIYVIESGAARVERRHAEFYLEVARLEGGQVFGEMSFVEGEKASASVIADQECAVAMVDGDAVHELAESDPAFAARFYRSLAEILSQRLRRTTAEGVSEFSWGGRVVEETESTGDVSPLLRSVADEQ